MSWDRDRALRHLKNAATASDAQEAADYLDAAARRLRFEDDRLAQSIRRDIRYIHENVPLDELQDLAQHERRRLERGW